MNMLVCKNVYFNASSCVSFVLFVVPFSFNFCICTSFSQHVCTMSLYSRHHRMFKYFCYVMFHAKRLSYLYLALCSSTLEGAIRWTEVRGNWLLASVETRNVRDTVIMHWTESKTSHVEMILTNPFMVVLRMADYWVYHMTPFHMFDSKPPSQASCEWLLVELSDPKRVQKYRRNTASKETHWWIYSSKMGEE